MSVFWHRLKLSAPLHRLLSTVISRLFRGKRLRVLTLNYLIENDADLGTVSVSLARDETIATLKEHIRDDCRLLSNVDYTDLILFKVRNAFGFGINLCLVMFG